MAIRYDFHLHSDFSADCDVPAADMILRALDLGLDGICFTEHYDPDFSENGSPFLLDFDAYFRRLAELRQQYGDKLWIGTGMEFGIMPHLPQALSELCAGFPFDFIIASQHNIRQKDPYYPEYFEGRCERDCYEEFFTELYRTLLQFSPDLYDTLGHLDYIVRYGPNRNLYYSYAGYADCIDPVLRHLIDHGKCLEVNTGGLKYGLGEPNPATDVLQRYRDLGGELVTLGSDAHSPQHLCFDFKKAEEILSGLGFRYYTVFEQRKARQIPL